MVAKENIQQRWRNKELLGYDNILFNNGNVIILDVYSVADNTQKSYYIRPICDTIIQSIEKYNDDPWTQIELHPQQIKLENGDAVYCGEGSMGNEERPRLFY